MRPAAKSTQKGSSISVVNIQPTYVAVDVRGYAFAVHWGRGLAPDDKFDVKLLVLWKYPRFKTPDFQARWKTSKLSEEQGERRKTSTLCNHST